jgi:hypothetical protein
MWVLRAPVRAPCPHGTSRARARVRDAGCAKNRLAFQQPPERMRPRTKSRGCEAVCRRATTRAHTGIVRHTPAPPYGQQAPVSAAGKRAFRARGTNRKSGGWDLKSSFSAREHATTGTAV